MENLKEAQREMIKNNQIYFNIKEGKVSVKARGPITLEELILITSTGVLSAMQSIVNRTPEEQKEDAKKSLYDMYNIAASNTLTYFAPELELRPGLTERAILEAENKIISEEYEKKKKNPKHTPKVQL